VLVEVIPGFVGACLIEAASRQRTSMFKPVLLRFQVVLGAFGSLTDSPKIDDVTHH
jgi:hypothetical protein